MGADGMRQAGVDLVIDSSNLGVVGFVEVLKHLPTFLSLFRYMVRTAIAEKPAAVVLIDYPGFNLRFAERMHQNGIPVIYYVSPQVWAWGRRRIPKMARVIDKMLVLFPFETEVFEATGLNVEFVGHPLVELLQNYQCSEPERDRNLVLLLPGSRLNEVKRLLQPMLETAAQLKTKHPEKYFVIPAPGEKLYDYVTTYLRQNGPKNGWPEVKVVREPAREWMGQADCGIAASGTVTIEAAILGLPLVVIYKLHWLTYQFARMVVDIPYFTMVNLVVQQPVFQEFLQGDVKAEILTPALELISTGGAQRPHVKEGMRKAVQALGGHTDICRNTALQVLETAALPEQ